MTIPDAMDAMDAMASLFGLEFAATRTGQSGARRQPEITVKSRICHPCMTFPRNATITRLVTHHAPYGEGPE